MRFGFIPRSNPSAHFGRAFESLILSDIPTTGEKPRGTLNSVITSLGRVHLKRHWRPFIESQVRAHLHQSAPGRDSRRSSRRVRRFINDWQDPETGFWGAWYRDGGRI